MPRHNERALVLAPMGRDALVICQVLGDGGIHGEACADMEVLLGCLREGAGIALVVEEALTDRAITALLAALAAQPSWSELPLLTLLSSGQGAAQPGVHRLTHGTRTAVLQRPVPAITLVTTARTLLQARRRQYEVRDLIERERAAREQAEQATRIKDEFLATVSHELRTPLSAITLWSNLIERGQLDSDQVRDAIKAIKQSADAQTRLIEDLLDLSRLLMGKLRLARGVHDLGAVVAAALEVVAPMAEAKGVQLRRELPTNLEVLVDADRMQQIVWNLLSNAVKFTPAGGSVEVRVWREPHHAVVSVADTGTGISPELLPHVFERFRQGDSSAGRRHAGLGIGLPIVKELVELHGGTIAVHSGPAPRGATFTIQLPGITGDTW
jgi:signal transduction histidine kinase